MFQEALKDIVERTDGGIAGLVMDSSGIALDTYTKEGAPFDINTIGIEFSVVIGSIKRAAEMLAWVEAGEYEDIVGADDGERRALARALESDPLQDVVLRAAAAAIGAWASEAGGPTAREAARTARRMMRYGARPLDPAMSRVFRVEVEVERAGADEVRYRVRLLTLGPSGAPTRVTLDLPERAPWTTVPTRLRESFVRENQRALTFELYRALPAGGRK